MRCSKSSTGGWFRSNASLDQLDAPDALYMSIVTACLLSDLGHLNSYPVVQVSQRVESSFIPLFISHCSSSLEILLVFCQNPVTSHYLLCLHSCPIQDDICSLLSAHLASISTSSPQSILKISATVTP